VGPTATVSQRYLTDKVTWSPYVRHLQARVEERLLRAAKSKPRELFHTGLGVTQFKELASAQVLEGKCWTAPILAQHGIYCRNAAGELVCLDVVK
jgi:hypothetical protein